MWKSAPPQARLPTSSGTRSLPIERARGRKTQMPPGAVTQTFPAASHFMPSGTPGSVSERMPEAKTSPPVSEPSIATAKARMSAFSVSLT